MIRSACLAVLLCCVAALSQRPDQPDLNVILMQNTFLVVGPTKTPGLSTLGTVFLLMRPFSVQPAKEYTSGRVVLVTAAHVLEEMNGDTATIFLRTHQGERWIIQPARFSIRHNGQALWKKQPDADVAVMYVKFPGNVLSMTTIVPTSFLADDEVLRKTGVVPGVDLNILGFPLGTTSNDAGFPILRTGVISSYPLLPTASTKSFLVDFRVFKGNSGGPVYYSRPEPKGSASLCCPPQFIMGLVSKEKSVDMPYSQLQLSLGEIVHASIITSTIEMLPAPETKESDTMEIPIELIPAQGARP
jgi:hypothetical protein